MRLLDFFREHNDDIVDLLKELVIRESPTSDKAAVNALGIPTLDGLGARGDGMHAENKHVIITSLPRRPARQARILQNWEMDTEHDD
jgi:hypothetical protein